MSKTIAIIILLYTGSPANSQYSSAAETVRNYSIKQKRLLVVSTFQFANMITQSTLDQDSVMNMARNIVGMPFLLPYDETFPGENLTAIGKFVNVNRINDAKHTVELTTGATRIQGLLEIALWYLHQDGKYARDLDSASHFIQIAITESIATGSVEWHNECSLQLAELEYQRGNIEQSSLMFGRVAVTALQAGNPEITGYAYMRMGDLLLPTDTSKENFYFKSLDVYQSLGLREKQIELLGKIELCHERRDFSLAKNDLRKIIDIAVKIGFKHTLYAQSRLAYVLLNLEDYLGTMEYAQASLDNMKWSGLTDVQGTFYIRMGQAYGCFGKNDEVVRWFKRALVTATKKSHLFWYKSIPMLAGTLCFDMNKPAEALSIVDSVTRLFPPITVWEKIQLLALYGVCNELLKKTNLADKYFEPLLKLANANPQVDPFGEMSGDYMIISQLYVSRSDMAMARRFLKLGLVKERNSADGLSRKYFLYYKIDSLEGKYKSALQNHIKYKAYLDSSTSMDQRKKMDELSVKYAAEKKDQDIKLLKQHGITQQAELQKNKLTKNIMIAGAGLLSIIVLLLFNQFKLKQRSNATMNSKNMALERLVGEKEWLLKEVHHRVKNNLHTVISLLESQAAYLEDDALQAIEKSQHRIYAMSLIHQKLYQTENMKTVDMSVYLPEFVNYLDESFGKHYYVSFHLIIEPLKFRVSQAIPIALIVNEAVTNSIKYAFPDNRKGIIRITMRQVAQQVKLTIADNGIGIDPSAVNKTSGSLGLQLIKGLGEDLQGSVTIINDIGTRISIIFNVDPWYGTEDVLTALN